MKTGFMIWAYQVAAALALIAVLIAAGPARAQDRHALVIGIDSYDNVPSLAKARNDARSIEAALSEIGFRTELLLDVDERTLLSELSLFSSQLDPGDEVVFFFAGHGVAIDGRNYLLPADVPQVQPGQELVVTGSSLPVDDVISQFNARGVRLSLLILDACRDNPFEQLGTRTLGQARGLGSEAPPEGTFVMFSAGAQQQALDRLSNDDPDPNSVFTRVLLPRLSEPGLLLRVMAQEVRSEVRRLGRTIGHEQFPAVYDQLDGSFAFVPGPPANDREQAAVEPGPCAEARADWETLPEGAPPAVIRAFISQHSECPLQVALAQARLGSADAQPPGVGASALTISPASVGLGEALTVIAEPDDGCNPFFFNLSSTGQITPLPLQFFEQRSAAGGVTRYVIDEGTQFGLVVTPEDAPGTSFLGFLCQPDGLSDAGIRDLFRALVGALPDAGTGLLPSENGEVAYTTQSYEIVR